MYYVVFDDCEQARVFHSSEPGTFKKFAQMNNYEIIVEADNIIHASMDIEWLSEEEVKQVHRQIEVDTHNEPILKRLEQLDKELPDIVRIIPPVFYVGTRPQTEDNFAEAEKKRIQIFKEQINDFIKAGYELVGEDYSGYLLSPPNYDEVRISQEEERDRLYAELWK